MKIENEFTVSVPVERAWQVLTDLEGIVPCMPGAQLTGVEGETYSGKLRVKVGPVVSDFAGTATFTTKDETAHRAVIDAKGRDTRGAGNASASIAASLRPDGDRTVVSVETDLRIAGKLAQFGNRMIAQVSEKLLGQFVDCLESKLTAESPSPVSAGTASATAAESPADTSHPSEAIDSGVSAPIGPKPSVGAVGPTGEAEAEPVDLVKLAGGTVAKRVVPLVGAVIVIALVIWYLIKR